MAQTLSRPTASARAPGGGLALFTTLAGAAGAVTMTLALYGIFVPAPTERTQGVVQRVFYIHVPLAWTAYLAFGVVFVGSLLYLLRRRRRWDVLARSSAEVGVVLTTLVIVSGSLWGKAVWGTWWTWDARLTSTLVLWFIYVAYLMLRAYVGDPDRAARYSAVLGIVGFLDIPIIHMSVIWWRTLHPEPVVLRSEGPALPPEMLWVLLMSLVAMTCLYLSLLGLKLGIETLREDLRARRSPPAGQ